MKGVFLGDIHIRREMRYHDIGCDKELFVGYCGSLGVTASDETNKPGLYYYNGEKLLTIDYKLPRSYIVLDVTRENIDSLSIAQFDSVEAKTNRPVFLCKLHNAVEIGSKLNFLYDLGHVQISKVKINSNGNEELVNIRSDIKTADRFSGVLRGLTKDLEYGEKVYNLAYKLLTSHNVKTELDQFKEEIYAS
jgi:hypothetical protein